MRKRSHRLLNRVQLIILISRWETFAHHLQVDLILVMRMGNGEGLGDPDVKSTLLKLAHPSRDTSGMGRNGAGPRLLWHLQVVADHQNSGR